VRASAARPRRTLGVWLLAVLAALVLVATSLHGLTSDAHVVGSPPSTKAANELLKAFPPTAAQAKLEVSDVVVVSSPRYRVQARPFRSFVARLERDLRATGKAFNVRSYLDSPAAPVPRDGHVTLVQLLIPSDAAAGPVESVVAKARGGSFAAAITGDHSVGYDFGKQSQKDLESGELAIGLPAALIVLVLVFGSVIAGLVPVLLAILSIVVGLGIVALISLAFSLSVFIVNMLSGMGLALGIDYSLFVVSRYREERTLGLTKDEAIAHAGATASRAVLFSGSTFVIALIGMFIVPTTIMRSLALGAIVVGIVSVIAALTLLPALLALVGDRVNALRVPVLGRNLGRADALEGRQWRRIVEGVLRRPALYLALAVAAMLAAASPIFGLHIGASGVSTLPDSLPSKQGYAALQRAFPVQNPYSVNIVAVGGT
jgi:RND superfamily putative drug exporter